MKTRWFSSFALFLSFLSLVLRPEIAVADPPPAEGPATAKPAFRLVVKNGGMTQGSAIPDEWTGKFGDVEVARDTTVFQTGPASLRVTVAGGKSGQAFQAIGGGAGATVKIAGWIRSRGAGVRAQVAIQAFADGYKQNQFLQLQYVQGDSEWTHFEKSVQLPPWTAFFNVLVLAEGDGQAWIDEVHETSSPVDGGQALTSEQRMTAGPPDPDKPTAPGWGFYPQYPQAWQTTHKAFVERAKQGSIPVLFLGDSITQGWTGAGKAVWEKRYAPQGAVDFGIGGDSTRQVLWRIQHGEIDGLDPRLVVLMIGTNNLYGDFNAGTDDEIAAGIRAIVQALRTRLPRTRLLLMGLLPRQNSYFSNRVAAINRQIAPLDDGQMVRFLDIGDRFQTAVGVVKPALFSPDQLHPVEAGYQVWADAMQPLFDALLAGKSSVKAAMVVPALPLPAHVPGGWEPVAMVTAVQRKAGIRPGGEGCQYPQTIAIDTHDGSFLLFGTDVGGIYRSIDGGATWMPCDLGFSAVGACGFAIDPRTPDRCLAVGDNSGGDYYVYDGIYLSTDRGASWRQVLPKLNRGNEKGREQIAFDPASYNAAEGYCTVAYWAEEGNAQEPGGRLYKTIDGGATWKQIAPGSAYGGGKSSTIVKVNPRTGALYLANDSGFYKSVDGGATFTRKRDGSFTSLDVVGAGRTDFVWATTKETLLRSADAGDTWTPVAATGIPGFLHLKVSPADPRQMLASDPASGTRYASVDGGATWAKCGRRASPAWIPADILYDDRCKLVAWHPTHPGVAWGIGPGDIITKTVDRGATFGWANNGYNGMMTGGLINFNAQNPDILYLGSQDYNGSLTTDGGATWAMINLSRDNHHAKRGDDGDAWGWVYGGYAASRDILYGGNRAYTEDDYNLWITFDGGKTTQQKYAKLAGAQVSCGDPTDPNVLFCWNVRSADRGRTWAPMTGCDGVFTASPQGKRALYGRLGKSIVRSADHGVTWATLTTLPAEVRDLAYDARQDRVYAAASDNNLYQCDGPAYMPVNIHDLLPRDQHGDGMQVSTVAVDPIDPHVVYAGANGTGLFFQRSNGVARSTDGGKTWESLTCNPKYGTVTGGQMASAIRVHPVTRYLYVGTDCYGVWKIAPPK